MRILLVFDTDLSVDQEGLVNLLQRTAKFVNFDRYKKKFSLPGGLMGRKTFANARTQIRTTKRYAKIFCFTTKQYHDNFFFYEYDNLSIFSLYAWNYLTDLPLSNGVLYFIINYLALTIDSSRFRHKRVTGCIYDYLVDKTGIDRGMRQAGFCSKCLNRLSTNLSDDDDAKIFEDLQELMNHLSKESRWNKNVLSTPEVVPKTIQKREAKNSDGVHVVIASPGDTEAERQMLLDTLEVRFRKEQHEKHCGFRIIVTGWEDLPSQTGYPQDIINEKIIDSSDFVIAVFKYRLGTPTKARRGTPGAQSGTVEELLHTLDKTKRDHPIGMAYFFSQAPVISVDSPDKKKIEAEWRRLTKFKNSIQERMIYKPYTRPADLMTAVLQDLEKNIKDHISK